MSNIKKIKKIKNIKIGGALPVGEIKKFLEASYDEHPPEKLLISNLIQNYQI